MDFKFTVVENPTIQIACVTIETDMAKASEDCHAVWEKFGPRFMADLAPYLEFVENGSAFGVSRMIDDNRFYYSAGVEVSATRNMPPELTTLIIPSGLYVTCTAPSLAVIKEAYEAMYAQFPQSPLAGYAIDMQGLCFEKYAHNSDMNSPFELFAAVVKA